MIIKYAWFNYMVWSKEYDSKFIGFYFSFLHDPVVEVVVEDAITSLEVEILKHWGVVHQVETVVYVISLFFS